MSTYAAPVRDMQFVLTELADLGAISGLPGYGEATPDLAEAILEEASRLAGEVFAPLNRIGDLQGSRVGPQGVEVADGFREAYRQFVDGGWGGLQFSPEYDGQGLPYLLATAVQEMWYSANMAFALCPLLTQGAIDAIAHHANEVLKNSYLPKMVSGQWTGTMNLTEPQAGSDLSAVRCSAVPEGDHYRIRGQKIFITWGDHDVAENIIHLVLARTPDAPEGIKGISLFVVPKFLLDAEGNPARRNDLHAVSVEHKMGIHGSPTCVMSFGDQDGAVGYLVGAENQGLMYMFTMMNNARLLVGVQGLSISERAYQHARDYARERVQGSVPGVPGRATIIHHADVRRMLMTMKSAIEAMRAVAYTTFASVDQALRAEDAEIRARHQARVDLLTPIVKGWSTELAQELTSLGVQIHGGMGFIEETGAAQHFRDARITTIYEGTTGIQAMDLVGRKTIRDSGKAQRELLDDMMETLSQLTAAGSGFETLRAALDRGIDAHRRALAWLLDHYMDNVSVPGSVAFDLLMLQGTVCGGWQLARAALAARRLLDAAQGDDGFLNAKLITAEFYATHMMPRCHGYLEAVTTGSAAVMALPEEQF